MAFNINRATIAGRVGTDPEVKTLSSGTRMATFSVATSESWKDKKSGEWKENTEWHRIVVYNEFLAKLVEEKIKKGTTVFIEGQIKTRKYTDSTGVEKYTTEIHLPNFGGDIKVVDTTPKSGEGRGGEGRGGGGRPSSNKASGGFDLDDEIPFAAEWR